MQWRRHGNLGVRTFQLFGNVGLVIRPDLHRHSEAGWGGVGWGGVGRNCFGDLTVAYRKSQILVLLLDVLNATVGLLLIAI